MLVKIFIYLYLLDFEAFSLKEFCLASKQNVLLTRFHSIFQFNKWPQTILAPQRPFKHLAAELPVRDHLLLWDEQIVIPECKICKS